MISFLQFISEDVASQRPKSIKYIKNLLITLILFTTSTYITIADTVSLPYNLDIASPVQLSGSDVQSRAFNDYLLSYAKTGNDIFKVSNGMMTISEDCNVRTYFVSESAGYENTLGVSSLEKTILTPDAKLIFPNTSSDSPIRTKESPLLSGDFCDLGLYKKGSQLDFFLIANGFNGGKQLFSTSQSLNSDSLIHAIALNNNGSPYQIIAFEDSLGGGDRDFNDCIFAIEFSPCSSINPHGITAPEPSLIFGACLSSLLILGSRRRKLRF